MKNEILLDIIDAQVRAMVAIATHEARIEDQNAEYRDRRAILARELKRRGVEDPNPHRDLWAWYKRCQESDLPTWALRRAHVGSIYGELVDRIDGQASGVGSVVFDEPTGWPRVDRGLDELRRRLDAAENEEQFQAVGLLGREVLISAAEVIYDPQRHPSTDGVTPSKSDAARMIDAYIAVELAGSGNEKARRHAKSALSLALQLQHDRAADFRQAALCAEATASVVNVVAIISGRRDRKRL